MDAEQNEVRTLVEQCINKTSEQLKNEIYLEASYHNVLAHYLRQTGKFINVHCEYNINYRLPDGYVFGIGRADIVLETAQILFIIEVKASTSTKSLSGAIGQLNRYARHIDNPAKKEIDGLVISFFYRGNTRLAFLMK